jgi:hypothetical protein
MRKEIRYFDNRISGRNFNPPPQMSVCVIILNVDPKFNGFIFSKSNGSEMSQFVM